MTSIESATVSLAAGGTAADSPHSTTLKSAIRGSGKRLESSETKLLEAFKSGDQDLIGARQVEYQREQRVYELLTTFIKNLHEMLMSVIRLLRLQ